MAGNYPDVPGHRMAYDRDGSILLSVNEGTAVITTATVPQMQAANNESGGKFLVHAASSTSASPVYSAVLMFPELRNVGGLYHGASLANSVTAGLYTSVDTTNGFDGTWTLVGSWTVRSLTSKPAMRNLIDPYGITAVKAVKWRVQMGTAGSAHNYHWAAQVYGVPASSPDRLRLWHPTLDQEVDGVYFDWGDVARSTQLDRDFRVKNSSALTANSVGLTMEALTDTAPSNVSQHTFSDDGVNFTSSLNIGNLAPGVISPVLTLRRTTVSDAVLSLWWTRIVASAASFS